MNPEMTPKEVPLGIIYLAIIGIYVLGVFIAATVLGATKELGGRIDASGMRGPTRLMFLTIWPFSLIWAFLLGINYFGEQFGQKLRKRFEA